MNEAAIGERLIDLIFGAITSPMLFILVLGFMQALKAVDQGLWKAVGAKSKRDPRQKGYLHPFYSFFTVILGVLLAFPVSLAYPNGGLVWVTIVEGAVHGIITMLIYQNALDPFWFTPMKIRRAKQRRELEEIERGR